MAHTRGTPVTSEEPTIDRRAAFKGALAAAGALDRGLPDLVLLHFAQPVVVGRADHVHGNP